MSKGRTGWFNPDDADTLHVGWWVSYAPWRGRVQKLRYHLDAEGLIQSCKSAKKHKKIIRAYVYDPDKERFFEIDVNEAALGNFVKINKEGYQDVQ